MEVLTRNVVVKIGLQKNVCQTGQLFKDPTHLEAPECAVRRVVLAAAAHLKGQGDGVPLHLEHLLGPARAQHRLAPEPVQVAPIFHHLGE